MRRLSRALTAVSANAGRPGAGVLTLILGALCASSFSPASAAADGCANAAIRVGQGATQLGDCRAFELVSPSDKNGADVYIYASHSSADGSAFAYQS